jgi:hypothetical protein
MATLVFDLGDAFFPLAFLETFFWRPRAFLENFPEISRKKFEAILFLDLGNPFETLAIIVILGISVRCFSPPHRCSLLVVQHCDLLCVLGSCL